MCCWQLSPTPALDSKEILLYVEPANFRRRCSAAIPPTREGEIKNRESMEAITQDRHTGIRGILEHYHGIKWDDLNLRRLPPYAKPYGYFDNTTVPANDRAAFSPTCVSYWNRTCPPSMILITTLMLILCHLNASAWRGRLHTG